MNIIKHFPESLSKRQKYDLTMSPKTRKMKDAVGTVLEPAAWALYEDTDKDGELREVLAILTMEGECYATNSATFIGDFLRIVDICEPDPVEAVEVICGKSKAGREFVTCAYAGD